MVAGVELGLFLIGTIDICLKYGARVIEKYKNFKEAQTDMEEKITLIEATWTRISQQLGFLQYIWDSLDEDYQDLRGRVLIILQRKLDAAVLQISKLEKRSPSSGSGQEKRKAGKYALEVKKALDAAIQAKCSRTDTLSVARHVRHALQEVPRQKVWIFLPEDKLACAHRSKIPLSTFEIIDIPGFNTFILGSVECDPRKDASIVTKDVRSLAQRLQKVDSFQFNLPNCLGVVCVRDPVTDRFLSFDFIFRMPSNHGTPQSLRSYLYESNYSLNGRINLVKKLATSVSYLHILDFVHKCIRPETVLIFQGHKSHTLQLFLLGFKTFRTADGKSMRLGNSEWVEDIYQHPERQGTSPIADYVMQHDIYSLGICLLEIGLWESFVTRDGHTNLPSTNADPNSTTLVRNGSLKDSFTAMSKQILPSKMGDKYAQVVVNCLTCMDDTNADFGDRVRFKDEVGI